jgi:hypothetical protein
MASSSESAPLPSSFELRPAVRFARSTYERNLFSVGSTWVPTWELAVALGPTFDPYFSGAAVSFAARAAIVNVELRLAAHTEGRGNEVMLLVGLTDLHGLWKLGPGREHAPYPPATPTQPARPRLRDRLREILD